MQLLSISEFLLTTNATLSLPVGRDVTELSNDYVVIMFQNMALKRRFYSRLLKVPLIGETESNLRKIVAIECGQSMLARMASSYNQVLVFDSSSPEQLLEILRGIPENRNQEISACVLNTLVVENLSAYFWELRSRPRTQEVQWYTELSETIQMLRDRYKCNVIVTVWDKAFEQGFNAVPEELRAPYLLSEMTLSPTVLFSRSTVVVAERTHGSVMLSGDKWTEV